MIKGKRKKSATNINFAECTYFEKLVNKLERIDIKTSKLIIRVFPRIYMKIDKLKNKTIENISKGKKAEPVRTCKIISNKKIFNNLRSSHLRSKIKEMMSKLENQDRLVDAFKKIEKIKYQLFKY